MCLETVVMATGYDCVDNTTSRAIVVTGLPGVTTGDLDGTIELNNLEDPVPFASTVSWNGNVSKAPVSCSPLDLCRPLGAGEDRLQMI